MSRFLKILLAMLALTAMLTSSAFAAPASASTDLQGQPLVNLLGDLQAKVGRLQVDIAKIKRVPKPVASAPVDLTGIETRLGALEQELSGLQTELGNKASNADLGMLAITVDELSQSLKKLDERVKALEDKPAPEPVDTITIKASGFHPIVYVGPALVAGMDVPEVSNGISARFTIGVRPMWDLSANKAFGLSMEGNYSVGGWGTRVIPNLLVYTDKFGGFGAGAGVGYNCDGLVETGCMSQHTGGIVRASWEKGGRAFGVVLNADLEVNRISFPGPAGIEAGIEARGAFGLSGYFGSTRPEKVRAR